MKDLRTIVLAAGKGTRMKSETPKVLHRVCGKPIIQYVLDVTKDIGSLKTYVVVGHKSEKVSEYLGKDFDIVIQKTLWGTADAVRYVAPKLKSYSGHVLILCGDTPLLNKTVIRNLISRHKKTNASCTVLTAVVHDPFGYGRMIRNDKGCAVAIREEKDATGLEKNIAEINVGVYCFKSRELYEGLKRIQVNLKKNEFYLTDIIALFSSEGKKIETLETDNPQEGLGVNTRIDLAVAESVIRRRILENLMLDGVSIIDPSTTFIDSDVKIGADTVIRPFTVIENDVKIGSNCIIGPFARIRPGSRLGNNVEVGNFAEVSRTKIGDKSLMKHFSFLGDTFVGRSVNIGAGTITANYDGVNKNHTKISDGAFIGSGSIMVSPVKIGKKAVIGAGSVVTRGKTIPDGSLAYGIPAIVQKKGK